MKRRTFFRYAGASTILPYLTAGCSEKTGLPDSRYLVATPEKRADYLARMLKELCTDLGPHPVGSPECENTASIVKREMGLALPEVEFDTFTFDSWRINGAYALYVGTQQIEAYPRIETKGTPPDGVSGIMRKPDDKGHYEVIEPSSGNILAYVYPYKGKARTTYASGDDYKKVPTMNVGIQDVPLLEKAILDTTPVRVNVPIVVVPNTPASNVVGTLPGASPEEILFIAHLDTVYNTEGANDNTASLIAMLMLAHAASGKRPDKTLRFLATTGEEYGGYRGATHYAGRRKQEGTLTNIKFIVNFDSGTWNPDIEIWSEDEELQSLIQAIDQELDINGTPQKVLRSGFSLDAQPFSESCARAIYVESNGQDKVYIWHRPLDTPANVQGYMVEICFQLFNEFIRRVQHM